MDVERRDRPSSRPRRDPPEGYTTVRFTGTQQGKSGTSRSEVTVPVADRTFAVVTTCHSRGWTDYGREMAVTFDRYWPREVDLLLYAEGFSPDSGSTSERLHTRDLADCCPDLVDFKARHGSRSEVRGWVHPRFQLNAGGRHWSVRWAPWRHYRYRWDAVRFSHKMFAILHAAATTSADVLIWIDADTRFFADVDREALERFVPQDRFVGFLARSTHTECGFVAYNLRHPATEKMLARLARMYRLDEFLYENEFHDSYLFDVARRALEDEGHRSYDIAQGVGRHAHHVLINSTLGRFMDHMKGKRKKWGRSSPSDVVYERVEPYWNSPQSWVDRVHGRMRQGIRHWF